MNDLETINPKAHVTTLGLEIADDLTFEEWNEFAPHLGDAALALGFAIGDWLLFGERFAPQRPLPGFENMPAKVPHERYQAALLATRLDIATLHNFAYVARNVPVRCDTNCSPLSITARSPVSTRRINGNGSPHPSPRTMPVGG